MNELDLIIADFDESQLTELLKNTDVEPDENLNERIKARVIPELTGEPSDKIRKLPLRKIIAAAAVVVALVSSAVAVAMYYEPVDKNLPILTTTESTVSTTDKAEVLNPLMLAIREGDESLVEVLLKNAVYFTKGTLSYALNYADVISYKSIREIAEKTVKTFGETGLDGLLESAILGDSEKALKELKERENMLMTPMEKLAFFFSVAYCDSEVVKAFLDGGYNPEMTNAKGENALDIAEKYGNNATAEFLKANENE